RLTLRVPESSDSRSGLTSPRPLRRVYRASGWGVAPVSTPSARLRIHPSNLIWFTPAKGACMRNVRPPARPPFPLPVAECGRRPAMTRRLCCAAALAALVAAASTAAQERANLPILVPITGALALEGQSQRDGALLAFDALGKGPEAPRALRFEHPVIDTGSNPQIAVQAFERALGASPKPRAMMGPIDGNSMLALLPLAERENVALLAVSGTARLTELGNKQIFRFFPSDAVVK